MPEVEWGSRGADKVFRDNEQLTKSVQSTGNAYKDTMREAQQLGRIASRIAKDNETAQERFGRQLVEAKKALDAGKISTEQLRRETTRLTTEYLRQTDGQRKLTQVEQHRLDVKRLYRQQLQHEINMMPQLVSGTHKLLGSHTLLGASLERSGRASASLFSAEGLARLTAFASKVGTVIAPLAAFAQAIEQGDQTLRKYGPDTMTAAKGAGGLAQLAGGDRDKLNRLLGVSREIFLEGGFERLEDAHRLTFELESGGILAERAFLSKLQASGLDDAASVAKSTSLVAAAFGRGEAGTTQQLVSKGLAAAGPATGAELADILRGVAASAASAKKLGLSDEENFALISRLSEVTGSGVEAGTQATALFRAMARQGFADDPTKRGNLAGMLGAIGAKGLPASRLIEFLGRQEAEQAFSVAQDIPAFTSRLADVREAQASGLGEASIESALSLPEVRTRREVLAQKAQAQTTLREQVLRRQRIDAQIEARTADRLRRGGNVFNYLGGSIEEGGSIFGIPIPGVRSIIPDRLEERLGEGPRALARTTDAGPSMNELAEKLDQQNALVRRQNEILERDERRAPVPTGRRE